MRLGGYVLFGDNRTTLGGALAGLGAVCDEVLAVDSGATDGSAQVAESFGARRVERPWRGYGAARAEATRLLAHCDYLLFLDADEYLSAAAVESLRRWRDSGPTAHAYRLRVNDHVELGALRFRLRSGRRHRIVRPSVARYRPEMLVHESLGLRGAHTLDAAIEHRFLTSLEQRLRKERKYAFLWGLQAWVEGRRGKWAPAQRPAHFFRDAVLFGAVLRGGLAAARVAWEVARYHQLKYEYLAAFRRGEHTAAADALRAGALEQVFVLAEAEAKAGETSGSAQRSVR